MKPRQSIKILARSTPSKPVLCARILLIAARIRPNISPDIHLSLCKIHFVSVLLSVAKCVSMRFANFFFCFSSSHTHKSHFAQNIFFFRTRAHTFANFGEVVSFFSIEYQVRGINYPVLALLVLSLSSIVLI